MKLETNVIYKQTQPSGEDKTPGMEVSRFATSLDRVYSPAWPDLSLESDTTRWISAPTHRTETGSSAPGVSRSPRYDRSDPRRQEVATWFMLAVIVSTIVIAFWLLWSRGL